MSFKPSLNPKAMQAKPIITSGITKIKLASLAVLASIGIEPTKVLRNQKATPSTRKKQPRITNVIAFRMLSNLVHSIFCHCLSIQSLASHEPSNPATCNRKVTGRNFPCTPALQPKTSQNPPGGGGTIGVFISIDSNRKIMA